MPQARWDFAYHGIGGTHCITYPYGNHYFLAFFRIWEYDTSGTDFVSDLKVSLAQTDLFLNCQTKMLTGPSSNMRVFFLDKHPSLCIQLTNRSDFTIFICHKVPNQVWTPITIANYPYIYDFRVFHSYHLFHYTGCVKVSAFHISGLAFRLSPSATLTYPVSWCIRTAGMVFNKIFISSHSDQLLMYSISSSIASL